MSYSNDVVDWDLIRREYEAGVRPPELAEKYEVNATAVRQRVYREKWMNPDKAQEVRESPRTSSFQTPNIDVLAGTAPKEMKVTTPTSPEPCPMEHGAPNMEDVSGALNKGTVPGSLNKGTVPGAVSRVQGTGSMVKGATKEEIAEYVEVMVGDIVETSNAIRRLPKPKTRKSIIEHERMMGMHLDRAQKVLGLFKKENAGLGNGVVNVQILAGQVPGSGGVLK